MVLPHFSTWYETWVSAIVRIVFGLVFLMSAYFKIPGTEMFSMQVEMSGAVGIPLPFIAVVLAFLLELVGGIALVVGWHTRTFALLFAGFVILVAFFFYRSISDQAIFAQFMSCVTLASGLLYLSIYGSQFFAIKKDPLPTQARM